MAVPESDWKNQPFRILDWIILGIGGLLLALYLFLWMSDPRGYYPVIAGILVISGIVYFTDYWQPILYPVVAIPLFVVMSIWIVDGSWRQLPILVTMIFNSGFILLGFYLFYSEERYGTKTDQA